MGVPGRTATAKDGGGGVDLLSEKATKMREALQKSETITDKMVSILGSFDHRLSALETAMRPTQVIFPKLALMLDWGYAQFDFLIAL